MSRYIDADKLKEKLDSFVSMNETYTDYNCGYDDCLTAVQDTLSDIPTVDVVERKHGYWVYNRGQAFGEPCYFCSLCIDGGSNNGRDNYCPNCGAKMDGERKDEE